MVLQRCPKDDLSLQQDWFGNADGAHTDSTLTRWRRHTSRWSNQEVGLLKKKQ